MEARLGKRGKREYVKTLRLLETFALADDIRSRSVQKALSASSARSVAHDPSLAELVRKEQDLGRQINAQLGALNNALSSNERDEIVVNANKALIDKLRVEIRCYAAGSKSFFIDYRLHGRHGRYTIGPFPRWSAEAAREEAKKLRKEIDRGVDPAGDKRERRTAPTVQDLINRYIEDHLPKKLPFFGPPC